MDIRKKVSLSLSLMLSMRYTALKVWHASSHLLSESDAKQSQISPEDGKKESSDALLDSDMPELPLDSYFP